MWYCEVCDNIMIAKLKSKHLKSKFHNSLVNSNLKNYIIPNPDYSKSADIIKKYFSVQYKRNNKFKIILLIKVLMPSNRIKYIRIQHSSSHYMFGIFNKHFFSNLKIIKEQLYSQVLEL